MPDMYRFKINGKSTTYDFTKAHQEVMAMGGKDEKTRETAIKDLRKVYDRNFTANEQKQIGNILIDIDTKPIKKFDAHSTRLIIKTNPQKGLALNHGRYYITSIGYHKNKNTEGALTHELIHARKFGIKGEKHNEKKIDFERVGRVSGTSLRNDVMGYYNDDKNINVKFARSVPIKKRIEVIKETMANDKKLLVGSVNKSGKGKKFVEKVEKLYPKSAFFQKTRVIK
jgi:hypothetical protein